jgi:hypothetical protein
MERRIHQESESVPVIIKEIELIIECLGHQFIIKV